MTRKLFIETSDGKQEINYQTLTSGDILRRIREYEQKYGSPFDAYSGRLSCDRLSPQEMTDLMDWECLEAELTARKQAAQPRM
jgi:hypothetical protein